MSPQVSIVKVPPQGLTSEILLGVKKAINLIGGMAEFASKGNTVLVKPNIGNIDHPMYYTNPSVTYAVAKLFSQEGCKVLIGEDPWVSVEERAVYEGYRIHQLAKKAGAEVVSLRNGPHKIVKVPQGKLFKELEVSMIALEADLVISVPVIKSASLTTVTLSLKNMKGIVRPAWKRKFHCEGLNWGIVDLNKAVKSGLTVVDGTFATDLAMGTMHPLGVIMASNDLVAADAVCARLMGFEPLKIDHIRFAQEAGLGIADLSKIEIKGEKLEDFIGKVSFQPPENPFELANQSKGGIRIIQGNPCSACLSTLGSALASFKDRLTDFKDLIILIGPMAKPPIGNRKLLIVGTCLKKYKHKGIYVHGCPPTSYRPAGTDSLEDALSQML